MKTIYFSLLLSFLPACLFAQADLSGKLQSTDQEPVGFANVILYTPDESKLIRGGISDADGTFLMEKIPAGAYLLKISLLGFSDYTQAIQVGSESLELGTIILEIAGELLETISVTAKKPVFERKIDRTVVNVQNAISSAGGDALEILEKSPGITVDRMNNSLSMMGRGGVIIAINGKRSRLETDALIQMLASTPAANIKKIELITNPPSSYDADGDGGVINIVMIKGQDQGLNGNVDGFFAYGERPKFGGGGNFNVKKGNFNLYGNGSSRNNYSNQNVDLTTRIQYPDQFVDTRQINKRPPYLGNHQGQLGFDWELSSKWNLSSFVGGSIRNWKMDASAETTYFSDDQGLDKEVLTSDESNTTHHYIISNRISYQIDETSQVSADYDYLYYRQDNPTVYGLMTFPSGATEPDASSFESNKLSPFDFHVMKVDYAQSMGKIQMEAGVKATISAVENDTRLEYIAPFNAVDALFTDNINLNEDIYAAYGSIRGPLTEKISFSAGLRYEYSTTVMDSDFDGPLIDRTLSRLFPNITGTYQFKEGVNLSLSYNERINRPGFQVLAPAFYFFDTRTILGGNINALPTISRSLKMDFSYKSIFFSANYTDESNPLSWGQPELIEERNLLLLAPRNIQDRKVAALSVSFPLTFTKFWSSRYNFNGLWQEEVPLVDGEEVVFRRIQGFANMSQTFDLGKGWETELSGFWNSRILAGLGQFKARLRFNLGVQKTFANKSKLSVAWQDLFNNGSFFGVVADRPELGIFYDWTYQFEGNIFRLSYSMPFGNKNLKTKGPRKAGSEDIQNRATN